LLFVLVDLLGGSELLPEIVTEARPDILFGLVVYAPGKLPQPLRVSPMIAHGVILQVVIQQRCRTEPHAVARVCCMRHHSTYDRAIFSCAQNIHYFLPSFFVLATKLITSVFAGSNSPGSNGLGFHSSTRLHEPTNWSLLFRLDKLNSAQGRTFPLGSGTLLGWSRVSGFSFPWSR